MKAENPIYEINEPHLETVRVRFHKVLVAIDLSPSSRYTVEAAMELAERFGSELVLLHVLDPTLMMPSGISEDIKAIISLWVKPYSKKDISWKIDVVEGDPFHKIAKLARQHQADLLIVGAHSTSGAKMFAFGSKNGALLRGIGIPVLTVGPNIHFWKGKFSSILLATDLSPHSLRAAQYAVALAEESDARLTLLHVVEKGNDEGFEDSVRRMNQLVPADASLWCRPSFKTAEGDPAQAILATSREMSADLIVMATAFHPMAHHASWSITCKIVQQADCLVLTVRDSL